MLTVMTWLFFLLYLWKAVQRRRRTAAAAVP